jgi:hypothetical protein
VDRKGRGREGGKEMENILKTTLSETSFSV